MDIEARSSRPPGAVTAALPFGLLACLITADLVLAYWIFARTPIQRGHTEAGRGDRGHLVALMLGPAVLALAAAVRWRWGGPAEGGGRVASVMRRVASLPNWALVMPVSLSASWVATRMALTKDPAADYWPAFFLWIAAIALLLASFLPLDLTRLPRVRAPAFSWRAFLRSDVPILVLLTAGAIALRTVDLGGAPALIHGDEEQIGYEAYRALHGELPNMFGAGWGTNPAMGYFVYGAVLKAFGEDIVSVRLASALWGAAAVPVMFLLLREMFGRWQALAGALFLMGYQFHLHMSRVGINVAWDTAVMGTALFFAYRASRGGRAFDFAATGLVCGLGLYLYHGTRVVPVVVGIYFVYLCAFRWRFVREHWAHFALLAGAFLVAAMPLGTYWATHQHVFWARLDEASIFESGWFDAQRDLGRSATEIMWGQVKHAFGGWFIYTDQSPSALYDRPKPLLYGLASVALLAGLVYSVIHADDRRYALLLIAFIVPTFLGGALTLGPPTGQRLMGAVPAVIGLISVGLWQVFSRLFWWRPALIAICAIAAAGALTAIDARTYFDGARNDVRWGSLTNTMLDEYFLQQSPDTRIYVFGLPIVGGEFSPLSLHNHPHTDVWDGAPANVKRVTDASPAAYIFLAGRESRLPSLIARCPGGQTRSVAYGNIDVLTIYELAEPNSCTPSTTPPDAFADALDLSAAPLPIIDYTVNKAAGIDPGEPLPCGMAGDTVWYTYTPSKDGTLLVDTNGSTFDTVLAAYTGVELASLAGGRVQR